MSSDKENEYFSDGITEEILNALSKIKGLHVTARTSSFAFKNQNIDVREIGSKLNVALLLEGSIRKSDDIVRITAQLTNASNGYHVWSETWDRELKNIFIVQDEIAGIIAEKINKDIKVEKHPSQHVIENTDAYDWYLKGIYLQNKWDLNEGFNIIDYYEKALNIDPELIKAHVGLCDMYTWLGATGYVKPKDSYIKIGYHIKKILEHDKDNPEVYAIIGQRNFWIDWDLGACLKNLNKALELQPSNADAMKSKGLCLAALGRVEEALDSFFQASRLDPFSYHINSGIGMIYNYINENEKAIEYIDKNIQIYPSWYPQYMDKVDSLCKLERYDEAMKIIRMIENDPNSSISANHLSSLYYAYKGRKEEALKFIDLLKKESEEIGSEIDVNAFFIGQIYIILGKDEEALNCLENGIKNNATPFLFIKILNYWDHLRDHPRYLEAIKRIKYGEDDQTIESNNKKYKKANLPKEKAKEIKTRLNKLMKTDKPYLNPTLNLSDLSEMVDMTTNQLSQILNEFIGKNFYDYVNSFRLEYFLELYKNPKYKKFTLLSVAYECGFNSKTTFNSFFKKTLGKTPSTYFKK